MGLFSSKKIISVSSTLYNMAGDENDRPDFLKGTIFSSVMADSPSLAEDLTQGHLNGPGMKQRQFFRYADREDLSGLPSTTITNNVKVDSLVVQGEIPGSVVPPAPVGLTLNTYSAEVNNGDFEPWLERWILINYPDRIIEDWLGEYNPSTNTFSIEFPNNDFFSWLNTDAPIYNPSSRYITAKYIEFLASTEDTVVEGIPTTNVLTLPNLIDFTQTSNTASFTNTNLVRNRTTTKSYNNGDPDIITEDNVSADVTESLNTAQEVWEREVTIQRNGLDVQGERQIWNLTGTDFVGSGYTDTQVTTTDLGGGVIETTTSVTTGEQVVPEWTTRYDTQDIFEGTVYGNEQIYIYEIGTGNATLDSLVDDVDASTFQEFFPFMPVRINNVALDEPGYEDLYAEMKKAYRRAYPGKSIDGLLDSIADNLSVDDIDYAYLCFGASLNVKEQACRRYIYDFFQNMIPFQVAVSGNAMSDLSAEVAIYNQALQDLANWENTNWESTDWSALPFRPTIPNISPPLTNTITLRDDILGFDYRLQWVHIEIEQFTGNYDSDPLLAGNQTAKRNDCILIDGPAYTWQERTTYNGRESGIVDYITNSIPSMYIYRQISDNEYRRMQIWGLTSYNYIYGGNSVKITSAEALADTEESGLLIPLHYPTMTDMGIVDYTQLSTANAHIMFNSYEVTKQRWYERAIFKILLVIAIIIVGVIAFPGAFAAGSGILGGNLAVGTAIGLTGTAALVAGVVANYIASLILAEVLKLVGTAVFGEEWGSIFAAIAGFAMGMAISGTSFFSTEGLLGLGNAIANGYSGYVQGDIAEMQDKIEVDREEYEEKMDRIQELINGLNEGNGLNFNPLFITDSVRGNGRGRSGGYLPETAEQFIRRTTMTGTDIVELTHAMVYDFVELKRTLPRN